MDVDNGTKKVLDSLLVLNKLYDYARLVDPLEKTAFLYDKGVVIAQENSCYSFWKRNEICDNCISMRTLNENKTFVKMEYDPNQIYMVTSIPIEIGDRRMVIELLKDITDSMFLENKERGVESEIYHLIDNLQKVTLKDALTGIYNRRYVNERLPADIAHAEMTGQSLSIIMADIDFFKIVNDTYGHNAGDIVLKEFARVLSDCLKRRGDWVSRYGGEEFLICLPGTDLKEAIKIAEEIRIAVEKRVVMYEADAIRITASFGVSSLEDAQEKDINRLVEHADKKLYSAKQNGRNRVEA